MTQAARRGSGPGRHTLDPSKVVASFDSASALHAAIAAALRGRPFPHLGNPTAYARAARVAGRLPWPLLRRIYARIGAAEGIAPERLGEVDMDQVAGSFAAAYPARRYPAVLLGSSNGALAHLAAALQAPWLPGTVLIPVAHVGDPERPDRALAFGREHGNRLLAGQSRHRPAPDARRGPGRLDGGPDGVLPDRSGRRCPTRTAGSWPSGSAPGAPVIVAEDRSRWPVTRVGSRHVFQNGGRGGQPPVDYLRGPHSPTPDEEAPEAEWGADPGLLTGLRHWCAIHGHPLVRLVYDGPQAAAAPVAAAVRRAGTSAWDDRATS